MDLRARGVNWRQTAWQISFALADGTRRRETVHAPHTKKGLQAVVQRRAAVLEAIANGQFDFAQWFPKSRYAKALLARTGDKQTVGELLAEWEICNRSRWQRSTAKDYRSAMNAYLMPAFGNRKAADISRSEVMGWMESLPCSNKRKNNVLIPMRQAFRHAYLEGRLKENVFERIPALPTESPEPQPFTPNEVQLLLAELEKLQPQVANYFAFAIETGLRTSELIALEWENVDKHYRHVEVRQAKVLGAIKAPKTRAGRRRVTLSDKAKRALKRQRDIVGDQGVVFCNPETQAPWKNDQALRRRYWQPALKAAGVPYRVPYQTRHTYASTKLSRGVPEIQVAHELGHANVAMIRERYGRWIDLEEH